MTTIMSACGVMCSECPAYHGAAKGAAHQRQTVGAWLRIYGLSETPEHISCDGCLSSDTDVFHTSVRCKARRCCREKGFCSCAECPKEGCALLEEAQSLWDGVPAIGSALSAADFEKYARPYCAHRARLANMRASQNGGPISGGAS